MDAIHLRTIIGTNWLNKSFKSLAKFMENAWVDSSDSLTTMLAPHKLTLSMYILLTINQSSIKFGQLRKSFIKMQQRILEWLKMFLRQLFFVCATLCQYYACNYVTDSHIAMQHATIPLRHVWVLEGDLDD